MHHSAIHDRRGPDDVAAVIDRILSRAETKARECRAKDPRSCFTRPGGVLGGATVTLTFADQRLKRQLKRVGAIARVGLCGRWRLERCWRDSGEEFGEAIMTAEVVADLINAEFGSRARAMVSSWRL